MVLSSLFVLGRLIMKIVQQFRGNDFVKSVTVLMTGTVIAQVFSFLISPILTRIYSPDEMGDLNIYMRIVSFLAALATARYELSLPLPKQDSHAYLLYRLSLRIALYMLGGTAFLSLLYFTFASFNWFNLLFALLTLVSTVFVVISNLGTNWSIRTKKFKKISFSRIVNAGSSNVLKWVFGLLGFGSLGLLSATFLGYLFSAIPFLKDWSLLNKTNRNLRSSSKTKALVVQYRDFPRVNLPHVLVDLGKDLALAFFIVFYFSKDVFGWYSLSYTILQLPIAIIGVSIGQVFFNRCAELVHQKQSTLGILKKTLVSLFLISILPFGVLFFFGEDLFRIFFGANWSNSGIYSEIMTSWFLMNFLISVISNLPTILNRQKEFFLYGIISAVIQLFCFGVLPLIIGSGNSAFKTVLWSVSIAQSVFFFFVLFKMIEFARKGVK